MLLLLMLLSNTVHAQCTDDPAYFKTKSVVTTIEETDNQNPITLRCDRDCDQETSDLVPHSPTPLPLTIPVDGGNNSVLDILDTVTKVWKIVSDNKPVVTIDSSTYATALPQMSNNHWDAIGGWKPERNYTIKTTYKNYYNMTTIYLEYQVKVVYGGNVKGKGLYIAAARIIPIKVDVLWGYTLNVNITSPLVFNVRTPENPIAAIQLNMVYDIKTVISEEIITDTYQVQGDGLIQDTKSGKVLAGSILK